MKKNSTIKSLCLAGALTFVSAVSYASTITATVSGNWSSAATWGGGTAGASITTDNIIIPAGITVNMDVDVQFNSVLSSLNVMGTLGTTSNSLTINALSTLSGSGTMNLYYLELAATGGMTFSGLANIHRFVTSATSLSLGAQMNLMDTLCLKAGSLSLSTGANLTLSTNSNIKVDGGSLIIGGGLFTASNAYNVMYVGSSKTAGIELGGAGAYNVMIQLSSSTQSLTLGSNLMVNGTMSHNMGTLVLNGKTLTIKGNYSSMNSSMLSSSTTSNLIIQTATPVSSTLLFNAGARSLNNMEINITSGGNVSLGTDLAFTGELKLTKGNLNIINSSMVTMNAGSQVTVDNGSILTSGGTFNGSASYNVNYIGSSKIGSLELTGPGLNDVKVQLNAATDSVKINTNVTVKGTLMLNKGSLNLNGKKLYLQGTLSSSTTGYFQGNSTSDLYINTTAGLMDTINFDANMSRLSSLTVNTGNSSNIIIGSNLTVTNILLTTGGITITNNDLTLDAAGSFTGNSINKYVQINGTGSLVMNVNSPSAYVMYPVGTTLGIAPAYIQRNSGSGMLGVNTHNGIYQQGTTGINNATTQSVVNRTWDIKAMTTASVDLNIKFEWTTAMEVNAFDHNNAYISHYTNSMWDVQTATTSSLVSAGTYQMSRTNITSLSPFAVVDNKSSVGIEENQTGSASASVYPNPATGMLNIALPNGSNTFTVYVYDSVGNLVITKNVTDENSKHVDLSPLSNGVYLVKISSENSQSVKRIVKQ